MPLYSYECPECGKIEDRIMRIQDAGVRHIPCPCCQSTMTKILAPGHGGIQCDSINDVNWLTSAIKNLPDDAMKIQSRGEHRQYLKEKNLIAYG